MIKIINEFELISNDQLLILNNEKEILLDIDLKLLTNKRKVFIISF